MDRATFSGTSDRIVFACIFLTMRRQFLIIVRRLWAPASGIFTGVIPLDSRGVLDHNGEQDTSNCMFRLDAVKAVRKLLELQIEVAKVWLLNLHVCENMAFFRRILDAMSSYSST